MNDQAITNLIKVLLNGSDASYRLKREVLNALNPDNVAIWWSVHDVEHIAALDEEAHDEPVGSRHDRSQFRDMLVDVCGCSEYGVTVETVEHALEDYKLEGA